MFRNLALLVVFVFSFGLFSLAFAGSKEETKAGETTPAAEQKQLTTKDTAAAPTETKLSVQDATFCTGIENLIPQGQADSFTADVGKVYFFTRIVGAEGEPNVKHRWLKNGVEVSSIILNVKASSWRTFSHKSIDASSVGNWSVEVVDENGNVLGTYKMTITSALSEGQTR